MCMILQDRYIPPGGVARRFAGMQNWNEKKAKADGVGGCCDCRFFWFGCADYVGKYHQICKDFQWD